MNFLTRRQETQAGATGSKLLAAPCVLRVRSGAGPITFFPGRPLGHWLSALWLQLSRGRGGGKGTGKGSKKKKKKKKERKGVCDVKKYDFHFFKLFLRMILLPSLHSCVKQKGPFKSHCFQESHSSDVKVQVMQNELSSHTPLFITAKKKKPSFWSSRVRSNAVTLM